NFKGTRLVNGHSANLAEKGELQLLIQHRFGNINGGFYELFGLDQASMRIGFEYGFGKNFNLGFGRSTYLKTYDLFGKYRIVQQTTNFPFTATVNAGGSFPAIRDYFPDSYDSFSDKVSGNVQLHLATTIKKLSFQVSPGFLKTGYIPAESENFSLFTMGFGGSFRISKKVSTNIEYLVPFNSDLPGKNPLSFGLDLDTGGHLFQIVISNNQRMFDQAVYTNTAGDWTEGSLFFGFNLIREFDINKTLDF
ncbi:DUF5777 family beta-barrel protein, partial [Draconibacterium sp.]|nr:DUF5777 family beta-barrel protein [Draconibacterium sp.]